jgi:SagB-type dehydrogenase family enzyme
LTNRDVRAALAYHESTKHSEASLRRDRHGLDWSNQPIPFKIYRDLEPIPLPRSFPKLDRAALEAIALAPEGRAGENEVVPDLPTLARVLFLSAGITKLKRYPGGETYFRAYANTGALYHVDLYVVCASLPGLEPGVYHFGPHDFALRKLRAGDHRGVLVEATAREPRVSEAPVILASASTYWRNAWKYQARAYRHCFWDAGTLHANLLAAAAAEGLAPRIVVGFVDGAVEELLGLDPSREAALTLVPLGWTAKRPPLPPAMKELELATAPLSRSEVDYPRIRAAHAASSLGTAEDVREWREIGATPKPSSQPARGATHPLRVPSADALPSAGLQDVIERRGSTRRFDPRRSLTFEELSTVLDRATSPLPADFLEPTGATLLELYLIVHAVEGLAPGGYVYRSAERALECLREGSFRSVAGRLGLFQELPAEAACNVYSLVDLDAVLGRFGNRGYRAAQLEGGVRGGRMYLAAYAQGFGASGLTFLDDEVTEFFSPHASGKAVMFLTALGRSLRPRRRR